MSTSWTWDPKSSPSARRPARAGEDGGPPPRLSALSALRGLRRRAQRLVELAYECTEQLVKVPARALLLTGSERHTGEKLRCLYVGTEDNLEYLKRLLYSGSVLEEPLGSARLPWARRLVARHEALANVVIVDVDWPFAYLFPKKEYLETPSWVNQSFAIGETWEETTARLEPHVRRNHARRARKHGLTARLTHDEDAARRFYREMYVPHLQHKFGGTAIFEPEEKILWCCREHGLLEVSSDGALVGATVLMRSGHKLKNLWLASRPGLDGPMTSAVFGALYFYTLTYAYEHGCSVMDYCGSRPTLSDGVLAFKRQWGARVDRSEKDTILLKPRDFSPPTLSFFVKNPFLLEHDEGLVARILRADKVLEWSDVSALVEEHSMEGIELFELCSTKGFEPSATERASREKRVRLVDLSSAAQPPRDFCRA